MTTLVVDIGNTRLKWRRLDKACVTEGFLDHHGAKRLDDEARLRLTSALCSEPDAQAVEQVLYASVTSESLAADALGLFRTFWPQAQIRRIVAAESLGGIVNGYAEPKTLGADRLLAMIGARQRFGPGALLVASLGTATTLDLIDARGHFSGGAILPGVLLMASALASGTAQLPAIWLSEAAQVSVTGNSTHAAIRAGIVHAQAGAIERIFRLLGQDHAPLGCVLTGGAAPVIAPHLPFATILADNLVLDGLSALAFDASKTSPSP